VSRNPDPADQLRQAWEINAASWTTAIRERKIESRRIATDAAIVQAVLEGAPGRVLDVGCGEGWLARALASEGVAVVGVDGSAPLIRAAREHGGGNFQVLSYAALAAAPEQVGSNFSSVVCNFALLEEEVAPLLSALRRVVAPEGQLYVQTVHPWIAWGEADYRSGWRTETFDGFGDSFAQPMPWYFRTLGSWVEVLQASGWQIAELQEPLHPETGKPLSLLLSCRRAATVARPHP
jgi:2-polyprenyl-3-methyl-5-hydroxy-6-metoxy-1,4-benzoquinol methylase